MVQESLSASRHPAGPDPTQRRVTASLPAEGWGRHDRGRLPSRQGEDPNNYLCQMRAWPYILLALALLFPELAPAQCAMCKAVVESSMQQAGDGIFGGQQGIGEGLNKGIILLMVVPYILLLLLFRKKIGGFWREFAGAQG